MIPKVCPPLAGVQEVAEVVRLVPGCRYRLAGLANSAGRWVYPPGDYRLMAAAVHVRNWQDFVVYESLSGPDAGRVFVCPLEDWLRNFTLSADPPPPEKVLNHRTTGSGA